jgi:hypothetical protein
MLNKIRQLINNHLNYQIISQIALVRNTKAL